MRQIAIIGSGPAGCYLAESLLRVTPDTSIDIFERLPVPFGLVRYGVAPDHQGTKAIARVLDRVLSRDRVSFFGNVEIGGDLQLEELMSVYDVVVLATGASQDRRLNIPGEQLPGVLGSAAFTGWYNGHPDYPRPAVHRVRSAVVIGNGNVAIDVARVLAKSSAEMAGSDLSPYVMSWLETQPIEAIHIVGRRSAGDAKFAEHELAELSTLQNAVPTVIDPGGLTGNNAVVETLRSFAQSQARGAVVTICFHFNLTPIAFLGDGRLRAVQFRSADGALSEISAELAVTCIGYEACSCGTAAPVGGILPNEEGKIKGRLYVVGWAKRGPSGTIPTNRTEAQYLAQKIAGEAMDGARPGRAGIQKLLEQRQTSWVEYAAWRRIDAAELARATDQRCRTKFSTVAEMLEAAQARQLRPA
jgi:NADPH-dependent glutamate synthase beta subunit-like oxidoreductase